MALRPKLAVWVIPALAVALFACSSDANPPPTATEPTTHTPAAPTIGPSLQPLFAAAVEAPYPEDMVDAGALIELAYDYRTVSDISSASSLIAIVRIETIRYEAFAQMPFTVSAALVLDTLKGTVMPEDTITIVETGGMHAGRSKDVPGEMGEPREVGFMGMPVMKPGEVYLLFLDGPAHVGPVPAGAYSISGGAQGKVRVGADGDFQFTGPPGSDDHGVLAVPISLAGRPLSDVTAEIRAMVE